VVVRLGLLVAVRWLDRQGRTGDGELTVIGFWPEMENAQWCGGLVSGRRWLAREWLNGGGLTVGLRRGDGDRERGRERFGGKMVWGREIDIEDGDGFSKSEFSFNFFF
jgi:hypothetical protein